MLDTEKRLRARIRYNELIACCYKAGDKTWFADIRGGEGEKLDLLEDYTIPYHDDSLIEGEFYSFDWAVQCEKPFKLAIIGKPQIVKKKEFLDRLYQIQAQKRGGDLMQSVNYQKMVFSEVTGADHTFIYELLQNANDYPYREGSVSVKFVLTPHYMFFMHSGSEFNLLNVVGICSVNQGEKKKKTKTIGYKGIGFKTVFVNNNYVFLQTGDWRFRFDELTASDSDHMSGECAWSLMPFPTETEELEREAYDVITKAGKEYRVRFAMRHRQGDAYANIPQFEKVFEDSQILLFIPHVSDVEVTIGGVQAYHVIKDTQKWIVDKMQYDVPQSLREWVEDDIKKGGKTPAKFKDIDTVSISFAVMRDGTRLVPVGDARIYNYLPTEIRLGIPFLINADFIPDSSRSGLHEVKWNWDILTECGRYFVDWWATFSQKQGQYELSSVFDILPDIDSKDKYSRSFNNGYEVRLFEVDAFPSIKHGEYSIQKFGDIINDLVGLTLGDSPVFTDEEFYSFVDNKGYLPHPTIREHENLKGLFANYPDECIEFSGADLETLCCNHSFRKWLTTKSNNIKFLRFIINEGWANNLVNFPIFLNSEGTLSKATELFNAEVERYMTDLEFLSDLLPRLDKDVRSVLEKECPTWEGFVKQRFNPFKEYIFTKHIFENFHKYAKRFEILANNVHFIHFLAVADIRHQLPEGFRLFTKEGNLVPNNASLYLWSQFGADFVAHPWLGHGWVTFLNERYLDVDKTKVQAYLSNELKIFELTEVLCCENFIENANYIDRIADNIKTIDKNSDFYLYLSNLAHRVRFSAQMRERYTVKVTDTHTETWVPVGRTIFYQNEDWKQMASQSWMPEGICLGLSFEYFTILTPEQSGQVNSFFRSNQITQAYRVSGLKSIILSSSTLAEIFSKITTIDASISFMNFLFESRKELFGTEYPTTELRKIPVGIRHLGMTSLSKLSTIYVPNGDLEELVSQEWIGQQKYLIYTLDNRYVDVFSGNERASFFATIGFRQFRLKNYLLQNIFPKLSDFAIRLKERSVNIAFHRYFSKHQGLFTDDEIKPLRRTPIYISSPENEEGVCVGISDNHYMPSELLSEIIAKDLVPVSIMDSIHPDYICQDLDINYYRDRLGNVDIDLDGFVSYISENADTINYLHDKTRNIKFWQWAVSLNLDTEHKACLANFPVLCKSDSLDPVYSVGQGMYLADQYSGIDGNEMFIRNYVKDAKFVSPEYLNGSFSISEWKTLFSAIKVSVNNRDIVFKHIIPSLKDFEEMGIVPILAQYCQEIERRLKLDDTELFKQLSYLNVKCQDNQYRRIDTTMVSGRYYDIEKDTLIQIQISNLISEEYLNLASGNENLRRNIRKLIVLLADTYEVGIETSTKLREVKIEHFCSHQEDFLSEDVHYQIIGYLADEYNRDNVGIDALLRAQGVSILLYSTTGKIMQSNRYRFSSIYRPECDFMGNGVNALPYVSERYMEHSRFMKYFLMHGLNVCGYFKVEDVQFLSSDRFAKYFWNSYAPKQKDKLELILTEERLSSIPCLPTVSGVKCPNQLYDYRIPVLRGMLKLLPEEVSANKITTIELPKWMDGISIGMRDKLSFVDCLEFLSKKQTAHRRDAMKWILESGDGNIHAHKDEIQAFRKDALWINGERNWTPLKDLVALEWGNETLSNYFGSNPFVCSLSYMPEYKEDYNRLCLILGITIINNNDFEKQKIGWRRDESAIVEIKKRLLYLSYKSNVPDWKDKYEEYCTVLDSTDISKCEDISYIYNDEIKTALMDFTDESDKLWYLGEWDSFSFQSILCWLVRELKLKLDIGYLKNIFVRKFQQTLRSYDSDFSAEFLALLSEEDRKGLKEAGIPLPEEFDDESGEDQGNPFASEDINDGDADEEPDSEETEDPNDGEIETENGALSDEEDSTDPEEDEDSDVDDEKDDDSDSDDPLDDTRDTNKHGTKDTKKGKERTSHGPKSPSSNPPHSPKEPHEPREPRNPREPKPRTPSEGKKQDWDGNDSQERSKEPRKNLKDRLKDKWNKNRQSEVEKPHPSRRINQTGVNSLNGNEEGPEERGDFFGFGSDSNMSSKRRISEDKTSKKIKTKNTQALNSAEKAQDNLDLLTLLHSTTKYSYLWFLYLMEIMYGDQSDSKASTAYIEFSKIKFIENTKSFSLQQASHFIPKWIESPKSISLDVKGTISFSFEPNVLFVKENELAIDTEMLDETQRKALMGARKVVLHAVGTNANHVKSLSERFAKLNFTDSYDLKQNLPTNIRYIYGPAGTGKTTTVAKQMIDKLSPVDRNVNILALAPTNKAADVIAERFLSVDKAKRFTKNLYRFGITDSSMLLEKEIATPTSSNFITYDQHHVVVTTIARFAYDYLQRGQKDAIAICDFSWDYIFIDEASMIDILSIIYVLYKANPKEFIIAGDPMQIRPISQNDIDPENVYDMVGINSFALADRRHDVETLKTQHRSIPILGNLTSELAYDGILQSDRKNHEAKPFDLGLPGMKHINFLGFRTDAFDLIYGLDEINSSAFHLHSVLFTYRFASYITKKIQKLYPQAIRDKNEALCTKETERYSLGIISPYGPQAGSIQNMLENRPIDTPQCKVSCGTVHKFQGDECDIILLVLNHKESVYSESHVNNLNLINVALSRARDYVFIITSQNAYSGFTMKADINKLVPQDLKSVMYCSDIEKLLWGDSSFIHNNTSFALHTPVNVFYAPKKIYEVRKDDSAVDIQINDDLDKN